MQEIEWIRELMQWLVTVTNDMGYIGLFIMTFLEATVMPIPAEATMIPVGYLVEQGEMNFLTALIISTVGTVMGAYSNYWLAKRYGRGVFLRFGKYFFLKPSKLEKIERFFASHGAISTFSGRILPGLRHFIALPAGLASMELRAFFTYTALGGFLCMLILMGLGYFIGANEALAKEYTPFIKMAVVGAVVLGVAIYTFRHRRKNAR